MPGLGRTQQVLIMMILWAVMLIVIDLKFNHHPERVSGPGSATHPQIIFGLNHLCCDGCYDNVYQAIKKQSWLSNPMLYKADSLVVDHSMASTPSQSMSSQSMSSPGTTPSATTPTMATTPGTTTPATTMPGTTPPIVTPPASTQQTVTMQNMQPQPNMPALQTQQEAQTVKPHPSPTYYGEVIADMNVSQLNITDLMKIHRDIEAEGLALEKFKIKNIPHFNLHIILPHLCCPTCLNAVGKICDRSRENPLYDDLKELPSLKTANVELDGLTLEFQDKDPTDVGQVLKVLRRIGYTPKEMHLAVLE